MDPEKAPASPFTPRLLFAVLLLPVSGWLWHRFVDRGWTLSLFLAGLIVIISLISVFLDLLHSHSSPPFPKIIGRFFDTIWKTILQLVITFMVFPLLPVLFLWGPVLILLFLVSVGADILWFSVRFLGLKLPADSLRLLLSTGYFFLAAAPLSFLLMYFAYYYKGGFLDGLVKRYVDSVVTLLKRLDPQQ